MIAINLQITRLRALPTGEHPEPKHAEAEVRQIIDRLADPADQAEPAEATR